MTCIVVYTGVYEKDADRGRFVVPIPPRQKSPQIKGWTKLRLEVGELKDAFGPRNNIGVILGAPSGGLIDIDMDCPEALRAAPFFLPETCRISGRKSNPQSHKWFISNPCPPSSHILSQTRSHFSVNSLLALEILSAGARVFVSKAPITTQTCMACWLVQLQRGARVSELTGLSIETLSQWRSHRRGIPYVKVSNNCVRYRQIDLDQWVGEHIVRVDADPNVRRT